MRLMVNKAIGFGAFALHLRAELTEEEKAAGAGEVLVSLSRMPGSCIFPLKALGEHDGHSPGWALDGTAPVSCSDPTATAGAYMQRITDAINAAGVKVSDVVMSESEHVVSDEPGVPSDGAPGKPEGWEKYGIN